MNVDERAAQAFCAYTKRDIRVSKNTQVKYYDFTRKYIVMYLYNCAIVTRGLSERLITINLETNHYGIAVRRVNALLSYMYNAGILSKIWSLSIREGKLVVVTEYEKVSVSTDPVFCYKIVSERYTWRDSPIKISLDTSNMQITPCVVNKKEPVYSQTFEELFAVC